MGLGNRVPVEMMVQRDKEAWGGLRGPEGAAAGEGGDLWLPNTCLDIQGKLPITRQKAQPTNNHWI